MLDFIDSCGGTDLDIQNLDCSIFDPPPCCPNDPDFVCDSGTKRPRTHWDNVRATSNDKAREYQELITKKAPPIPSDAIFKLKLTFRALEDDGLNRRRLTSFDVTAIEGALKDYIGVEDAPVRVVVRSGATDPVLYADVEIELPETATLLDLMDTNVYLFNMESNNLNIPGIVVEDIKRDVVEENGNSDSAPTGTAGNARNTLAGLKAETSMILFIVLGVVAGIIIGAALMFAVKSKSKAPVGKPFETVENFNVRNPMAAKPVLAAAAAKSAPDQVSTPRRVPRPNTAEHAQRVAFATMQRSNSRRPVRQTPRV